MDQLYYESGYIDASYFVYTAEAESAQSSSFEMITSVSVIKEAQAILVVTSEVQATISHINGADLFAMSNAELAAEVSRIRDNNIEITSAFTQVCAGAKVKFFGSDQNSDVSISVDNTRVRFNEAAVDAAFSLTADLDIIPGGIVYQGEAALSSEFTIDAKGTRKQNIIDFDVSAEFTQSTTALRFAGLDSQFDVVSFVVETGPSRIRNESANLESQTTQTTDNSRTRSTSANLESQASVNVTAERFRGIVSNQTAQTTVTVDTAITKPFSSSLQSNASLTATISHIEGADLQAFTNSSLSIVAVKTTTTSAQINSEFNQTVVGQRIRYTSSAVTAQASVNTTADKYRDLPAALTSAFTLSATPVQNKRYLLETTLAGATTTYNDVAFDSSGNTYVVGSAVVSGVSQLALVKLDQYGVVQWQRKLSTTAATQGYGVIVDATGSNVYVSGSTGSTSSMLVAKYDSSGTIQWQRTVAVSGGANGYFIALDTDGSIVVVNNTGTNAYLKFDTSGNLTYSKQLSLSAFTIASDGYRYGSQGGGGAGANLFKYNSADNTQTWYKRLTYSGWANFYGTGVTTDANYVYMAGGAMDAGFTTNALHVSKWDLSGNLQWVRSVAIGSLYTQTQKVLVDAEGNVYLIGRASYTVIVKFDANGNLMWQHRIYNTSNLTTTYNAKIDSNGFIHLAGEIQGSKGYLIKIASDGTGYFANTAYKYETTNFTVSSPTPTVTTSTLFLNSGSLSASTSSLTSATSTYTNTRTVITGDLKVSTVAIETMASELVINYRVRYDAVDVTVTSNLSAVLNSTQNAQIQAQVTSTLTAQASITASAQSQLALTTTQTTDATTVYELSSALEVNTSVYANVRKLDGFISTENSQFTMTVIIGSIKQNAASITSQSTVNCDNIRVRYDQASLDFSSSLVAETRQTVNAQVATESTTTTVINSVKTASARSTIQANGFVFAIIGSVLQNYTQLNSAFALSCTVKHTASLQSTLSVGSGMAAVAKKVTRVTDIPFAFTATNTGGASSLDGISPGLGETTYDYYGNIYVDPGPLVEG